MNTWLKNSLGWFSRVELLPSHTNNIPHLIVMLDNNRQLDKVMTKRLQNDKDQDKLATASLAFSIRVSHKLILIAEYLRF